MKKSKLIDALKEAINTEETATTIYLNHIKALTERFGMKDRFIKKFVDILGELIEGNKYHKKKCEEILRLIEKGKRDDI